MSLLAVERLSKSFGGVTAARDVSFSLEAGKLLAIIGPNGAGKSTIFNMVGGQLAPDAGRVLLAGRDITAAPARRIWRLGVGRTFQIAQTFVSMTVAENVQMALISRHGRTRAFWPSAHALYRDEALALLERLTLRADADRPCSELAYGDVKRVELAIALAGAPKLLLMDEPTAGMAPSERNELMQLADIAAGKAQGTRTCRDHAHDCLERRRLAGAIATHQGADLAVRQRQGHVKEDLRLTVGGIEAVDLENGRLTHARLAAGAPRRDRPAVPGDRPGPPAAIRR